MTEPHPEPFAVLVEIDVEASEVDVVSGRLWLAGAVAIEELPQPGGRVRLRTTTTDAADVGRLLDAAGPAHPGNLIPLRDDTWFDVWRAHARARRAGERFILCPSWVTIDDDLDVTEQDVVLRFDPGRAFGSGAHQSTRLAVAALERVVVPGTTVLDVGCGSGVLSLAAAALGASGVTAVDIDPEAVRATRANLTAAGLGAVIDATDTPLSEVEGTFEVVVANILAVVLRQLAPDLRSRVRPGGTLVLAGALTDQEESLLDAFGDLELLERTALEGWIGLELRAHR